MPPDIRDRSETDLALLHERARNLSSDELDRELADLSNEVEFLEKQLECDIGSYTTQALERANQKVSKFKLRAEILKVELDWRSPKKRLEDSKESPVN